MAKNFDVNIQGKETLSRAADNAVRGLNRLRAQIQAVQNSVKFFAGGAVGFQMLRWLGDSVEAYRKSEEAAAKLGRAMAPPAVALTRLNTAFGDLRVAAGESFATGARPVVEWLAQVADDAARSQREVTAAKRALDELAAGNQTVQAEAAMRGMAARAVELRRAIEWGRGDPRAAQLVAEAEKQLRALEEEQRSMAAIARWQALGEAAAKSQNAALEFLNKLYPTTIEYQRKMAEDAIRLAEAFRQVPLSTDKFVELEAVIRKLYGDLDKLSGKPPIKIRFDLPEQDQRDPAEMMKGVAFGPMSATGVLKGYWTAWDEGSNTIADTQEIMAHFWAEHERQVERAQDSIKEMGSFMSGVFEGVGKSLVEGTAEGFAEAFKGEFVRLLGMLSTYAWAQVAASIFPLTGFPNVPAAAAWTAAALAASTAAGAINQMYQGGILDEMVVGRGLRTGKAYSFAEYGPEVVTPLGRSIGSMHNTYISVRGSIWETDRLMRTVDRHTRRQDRGY